MDFAVTFQKGKGKKEKEKIPENKEGEKEEKKDEGRENDEEKTKKGGKKMEEENYKKHFRYSTTTNSKVTVYLTTPITIKICRLYNSIKYKMTLSKILCKWKQDSVVSLFL